MISRTQPTDDLKTSSTLTFKHPKAKTLIDQNDAENVNTEIKNLKNIFNQNKSFVMFIAGHFNSKVGRRKDDDDDDEKECMGRYSVGESNDFYI